jgi:hypothetical protein
MKEHVSVDGWNIGAPFGRASVTDFFKDFDAITKGVFTIGRNAEHF